MTWCWHCRHYFNILWSKLMGKLLTTGSVYVMTHSLFSDVVRIGTTPNDPEEHAKQLSKTSPGDYQLFYTLSCDDPTSITERISSHLRNQEYANQFYQITPSTAKKIVSQEILRIPLREL